MEGPCGWPGPRALAAQVRLPASPPGAWPRSPGTSSSLPGAGGHRAAGFKFRTRRLQVSDSPGAHRQACPGHLQQHGRQDRKRQPARRQSAASGRRGRPEDGARRRLRRSESRLRPRQAAHDRTRTFESTEASPWYHHQREKSASASGSSEAAGHRQNKPSSRGLVFAQPSASGPLNNMRLSFAGVAGLWDTRTPYLLALSASSFVSGWVRQIACPYQEARGARL